MKAVWKISGEFFGWILDNSTFFDAKGKRRGTFQDNILYNHNGKYWGELVNENFIGFDTSRYFLEGPECNLDEEVLSEPLPEKDPFEAVGFVNPK